MINGILAGLSGALVLFDVVLSGYRMHKGGLEVELNPLVRKACAKFGIVHGLMLTAGLPWAVVLTTAYCLGWTTLLGILFGMRFMFGLEQFSTLKIPKP